MIGRWVHPLDRPDPEPRAPQWATQRAHRRDRKRRNGDLRHFGRLIARGLAAVVILLALSGPALHSHHSVSTRGEIEWCEHC